MKKYIHNHEFESIGSEQIDNYTLCVIYSCIECDKEVYDYLEIETPKIEESSNRMRRYPYIHKYI